MAPHSSTLAWKIPWTEEPGGPQSMGLLRVGHDFTFIFTFHFPALEKEMATHSSVLAWSIPGTGEPGGLPSVGSHRVGHDWNEQQQQQTNGHICKISCQKAKRNFMEELRAFPVSQPVKNMQVMQETQETIWVWSLDLQDPVEKEMATYSGILSWEIQWTAEPGELQSMGSTDHMCLHTHGKTQITVSHLQTNFYLKI